MNACATKNSKDVGAKYIHIIMTFSKSLTVTCSTEKLGYVSLIFADPKVKVNGAYYLNCFCHNSCCLLYIR